MLRIRSCCYIGLVRSKVVFKGKGIMKTKIFLRLMALTLIISVCLGVVPTLAATLTYSPGITKYELDRNRLVEANGVTISGEKLVFEAGGSVTFDVLLPFDTESIYFIYETITENTMFTVAIDGHSYPSTWFAGGSVNSNKISVTELCGSHTITLTAAKAVTVTSVNFRKVNEGYSEIDYVIPKGKDGALFVKEGSVFVTQAPKKYLKQEVEDDYTINIFAGKDCSFDLIEDDGITYAYKEGGYGVTHMDVKDGGAKGFTLTIGKRVVPGGQDIELSEITDFAVKVYATQKPSKVTIGAENVAFSYDEETKIASFSITKEQREKEVVCDVVF